MGDLSVHRLSEYKRVYDIQLQTRLLNQICFRDLVQFFFYDS